nr:GNAT family N-acetyltransferase [Thauera linaloolentis]
MRMDDLDAVMRIQREAYGDAYQESADVLGRKLSLAPEGCWFAERGGEGLGYVFAHPWSAGAPCLHAQIENLPPRADHGFLHDLAVSPRARGLGVGRGLFGKVRSWSERAGHQALALVALADAVAYWRGLGFAAEPLALPDGYGAGAVFMRYGPAWQG